MLKVKVVRDEQSDDFEDKLELLLNKVGPASIQYRPNESQWEALVIYEELGNGLQPSAKGISPQRDPDEKL